MPTTHHPAPASFPALPTMAICKFVRLKYNDSNDSATLKMSSGKGYDQVMQQIEAATATRAVLIGKGASCTTTYMCSSYAPGQLAEVDLQDVAQAIQGGKVAEEYETDFDESTSVLTLHVSFLVHKKIKVRQRAPV